jgi:glutamate formiminotransferase/formiminotetrahydrofolate cyclodeaminase
MKGKRILQPMIECVPNFSEGRDQGVIRHIADAIQKVSGVTLLSVEPGADANRTVMTFIGSPEAVGEAAFAGIATAAELIDMQHHHGIHPRIGATDVCPFVPLANTSMETCIRLSHSVGKRVGETLGIPVFLYEYAATRPERRLLATIRAGQYEGLPQKLNDPRWQPDYGPAIFNPKSGATVIGARDILIAFNVNIAGDDVKTASEIAGLIRESGQVVRDPASGKILRYADARFPCGSCTFVGNTFAQLRRHCLQAHHYDPAEWLKRIGAADPPVGLPVRRPGMFPHLRALGWYVASYKRCQITMNFTNYRVTPPHIVYEKICELAAERGLTVTGSEVIGMVPDDWVAAAGKFYLQKNNLPLSDDFEVLTRAMSEGMNLNDVVPFEPQKKILPLRDIQSGRFPPG